jgi:hypothetical protein
MSEKINNTLDEYDEYFKQIFEDFVKERIFKIYYPLSGVTKLKQDEVYKPFVFGVNDFSFGPPIFNFKLKLFEFKNKSIIKLNEILKIPSIEKIFFLEYLKLQIDEDFLRKSIKNFKNELKEDVLCLNIDSDKNIFGWLNEDEKKKIVEIIKNDKINIRGNIEIHSKSQKERFKTIEVLDVDSLNPNLELSGYYWYEIDKDYQYKIDYVYMFLNTNPVAIVWKKIIEQINEYIDDLINYYKTNKNIVSNIGEKNNNEIFLINEKIKSGIENKNNINKKSKKIDTSFDCSLSEDHLKEIHKYLKINYFINADTPQNAFIFIFRNIKINNPVKWILKAKNSLMNKKALIDFISVLAKYECIPIEEGSTKRKTKDGCMFEKIELCFRDEKGNKFKLNDSSKSDNGIYYRDFIKLIEPFVKK